MYQLHKLCRNKKCRAIHFEKNTALSILITINRPRQLSMQFFSVCFIKSLTDKRSVKFQLPWRGSTNLTVVSSETERPMYHLGTDRDPVYTDPNEYLPVQPFYTSWSHRTNSVTALHCLHESVQILPVSILNFF